MALTVNPPTDPTVVNPPVYDPNRPPPEQPVTKPVDPDDPYAVGNEPPPPLASSLPDPDADPEKRWMDYGVQAINQLYPWARNGVDFAWGRTEPGGDASLLEWSDKLAPADEGAIEEAARKLADADPYGPNYTPQPSLAGGTIKNAPDEVQRPPPST